MANDPTMAPVLRSVRVLEDMREAPLTAENLASALTWVTHIMSDLTKAQQAMFLGETEATRVLRYPIYSPGMSNEVLLSERRILVRKMEESRNDETREIAKGLVQAIDHQLRQQGYVEERAA